MQILRGIPVDSEKLHVTIPDQKDLAKVAEVKDTSIGQVIERFALLPSLSA